MGKGLESAQAERGENEIEQGLEHVCPTQHGEHQWNARPDVMKRNDDRAEDQVQEGDGKHARLAAFSEKDEEVYPHARPHYVGHADDREIDDRVDLDGAFHGTC